MMEEAATYLSVSVSTIRRWIRAGDLKGYRKGGRIIRLDLADVEKLLRPIQSVKFEE